MTSNSNILGLIAGGGQFPFLVAQNAQKKGYQVVAVGFVQDTEPDLQNKVDSFLWLKLGQLNKLIKFFQKNKVNQVTFAGPINKPRALNIRPDFRAAKLLFKLKNKNDDAILRAVARELEQEGFRVVAANNFVPELIALSGQLSKRKPSAKEIQDILFAWPLVKKLGELDIGQCIVVRDQMVVAVESIEGTNATILRAGQLAGKGCVVVKAFKPGQDSRIDIPALGSKTIEVMAQAGATCLAYEAGKSLFFELDRAISLADKNKIAVIGIDEQLLQRLKSLSDGKKNICPLNGKIRDKNSIICLPPISIYLK